MSDAQSSTKATVGRPFKPGQSGNPGGSAKGFGSLIREQTRDGGELVAFALAMVRGKDVKMDLRFAAVQWLADRGWGKPVQLTEASGEVRIVLTWDDGPDDADA